MNFTEEKNALPLSERYKVFVDSEELEVIMGDEYDYVHIITKDIVSVEVKISEKIEKIDLRPTRRAKPFKVEGESVKFLMARGDYYCFELNGDLSRPLLLFCDEKIEKQLYDGQNLVYFGKGYHNIGKYSIVSNTVIFIDEGAVVGGCLCADGASNIRIIGNGILCSKNSEPLSSPIGIFNGENIEINGITVIGINRWNVHVRNCKKVLIENLKILAHEIWSDGIDVVSCQNVVIRHIFIKNEDDCVCIKSSGAIKSNFVGGDVRNVLVEDCVLWSGPRGNSLEIGYETNNSVVENILFCNVDVIHRQTQDSKFHRSIISIHNAGNATIRNITYENIYAEETEENFIQISHMHQPDWGVGDGVIEDIRLRSVTLAGGELRESAVRGYPRGIAPGKKDPCVTKNITFENLKILGKEIRSTDDAKENGFYIDEFAENVRFL